MLAFFTVLLLLIILPFVATDKIMFVFIIGFIGAIAALGVNPFYGYCGQVNFGAAGFMAIGGYGVALLERDFHTPYLFALIISVIATGIVALLVSFFLLRLRHFVLGLGTMAFGLAIYSMVSKGFTNYTSGEDGISLAYLQIFGIAAETNFFYYAALFCVIVCIWISGAVRNSRIGRGMVAIAQNEVAATSMGVNINGYLRIALLLNGLMCGLSGGLFVKYLAFCSPAHFSLANSILIFIAVIVGGAGSAIGAAIGGFIMFTINELLTPLALYHTMVYGAILAGVLMFMPEGIVGGFRMLAYRLKGSSGK
jgi:branched-chain amino acid transport system permease protein